MKRFERQLGLFAALAALLASAASAGPEGERVVSGSADFVRDGDHTQITTGSRRTIVEYSGFDIGQRESVQIVQPGRSSRILNRVRSSDPTRIDGRLTSNGQVWVLNPVGVFFGERALVDVGGLVAGAGEVSDRDFLDGRAHFRDLSGAVEVARGAEIHAADRVWLVGERVANYGHIAAEGGMIALVAGDEVLLATLDGHVQVRVDPELTPDPERWALVQGGELDAGSGSVHLAAGDAYALAMNHRGITRGHEIHVEGGEGGLVEVAGLLDATITDHQDARGGRIHVLGDRISLDDATLDASGRAGGGDIRIGGDVRGGGDLPSASRSVVSEDSLLRADALEGGDGGRIVIWADEATAFSGRIVARGGEAGGDGGFAEISGAFLLSDGEVDLSAPAGATGTLLYDPQEIEIRGGSGDGSDDPNADVDELSPRRVLFGTGSDLVGPFEIFESEIEGTDANVRLEATHRISSTGVFTDDDLRMIDGNDLVLRTRNDEGDEIGATVIEAGIDLTGLSIVAGEGAEVSLTTGDGGITVGDISIVGSDGESGGEGGAISLVAGGAGAVSAGTLDVSGGAGTSGAGGSGGAAVIRSEDGDIDVAGGAARGGAGASASGDGNGGAGGALQLSSARGSITVGALDVSGGEGFARTAEAGVAGGDAGSIAIVADLDPGSQGSEADANERKIELSGDLLAIGGAGSAAADIDADGGQGGQVLIGAGLIAEDEGPDAEPQIEVVGGPIQIDASGGFGSADGGSGALGGFSAASGAVLGALRVEAFGDIALDAEIRARGGRGGTSDGISDVGIDAAGGAGGIGGDVSIESSRGDVTLSASDALTLDGGEGFSPTPELIDEVPVFRGRGGSAGNLQIDVAGEGASIDVQGTLRANGGEGTSGSGGSGGRVTLNAPDGSIALADVELNGADGSGNLDDAEGEFVGTFGGSGGTLVATTRPGLAESGAGDITLGGDIVSLGGVGVAEDDLGDPTPGNEGIGGSLSLSADRDLLAAPGASLRAGSLDLVAREIVPTVSGSELLLAAADSGPEDRVERASLDAEGALNVRFDDDQQFERVELLQRDASAAVEVLREDGATEIVEAGVSPAGSDRHRILEITTQDGDPHLTYRLATSPIDVGAATLEIAGGAVDFGTNGGRISHGLPVDGEVEGERLLGRIEGVGAGPHVGSSGPVELLASGIGGDTVAGLVVEGSAAVLEVGVAGDAVLGLDDASTIGAVDLVQRGAASDVAITFQGGDPLDPDVRIDGSVVDDGRDRTETAIVERIDSGASGTGFFFHLADSTQSSNDAESGEPGLLVRSAAVTLGAGAEVGLATRGTLDIESGAIDANGGRVWLIADSNFDGDGALTPGAGAAVHVANASALAAFASGNVGSEAEALRASAPAAGSIALSAGSSDGDLYFANEVGEIAVEPIRLDASNGGESDATSLRGLHAGGVLEIDNGGRDIVFGEIQPGPDAVEETVRQRSDTPSIGLSGGEDAFDLRFGFGDLRFPLLSLTPSAAPTTNPHAQSGGGQRYAGALRLANPRDFTTIDPDTGDEVPESLHEVRLVSGGDVEIEGAIDSADPLDPDVLGTLIVSAAGTTVFEGDVGGADDAVPTVDELLVGAAHFVGADRNVRVNVASFGGRVEGDDAAPVSLRLRALEELRFDGDLGRGRRFASLDAAAPKIVFGDADHLAAGSVALNAADRAPGDVPEVATISDTRGGLEIRSDTSVTIGAREKLSVAGPLEIRAGGEVSVGDLSATRIDIDAPRVTIRGREAAPVARAGGATRVDGGVDWVANSIRSRVRPQWDGFGPRPTFVLGSGGVNVPGRGLPFDAIRVDRDLTPISPASFAGGDPLLDLFGEGPRLVADPSESVPRGGPGVRPISTPRSDDAPPAAAPRLGAEQVLGFVRCRASDGSTCGAEAAGGATRFADSTLATERASAIVGRYHDLIGSDAGRRALAEAFAAVPSVAGGVEGQSLYRVATRRDELAAARERIDELATVLAQISLLGLDAEENERVRRAVAGDFAAATGLAGFDADAALAAARTSGVGALPPPPGP